MIRFVFQSLITKEPIMKSLVVGVTGVVVGALGTLLGDPPKQVAQKLRAAAAVALDKLRAVCPAGQQKGDESAHGPEQEA